MVAKLTAYDVIMRAAEVVSTPNVMQASLEVCESDVSTEKEVKTQLQ